MKRVTLTSALTLAGVMSAGVLATVVNTRVLATLEGEATETNQVELVEGVPMGEPMAPGRAGSSTSVSSIGSTVATRPPTTVSEGAVSRVTGVPAELPPPPFPVPATPPDGAARGGRDGSNEQAEDADGGVAVEAPPGAAGPPPTATALGRPQPSAPPSGTTTSTPTLTVPTTITPDTATPATSAPTSTSATASTTPRSTSSVPRTTAPNPTSSTVPPDD